MTIDLLIWGLLAVLAVAGGFMTVERVLFHRGRSEADPVALRMRLALPTPALCRFDAHASGLGWLSRQLRAAGGLPIALRRLVEFEIRMTSRFQAMLGTIATAAMAVGLLGTVASLYQAGAGDGDVLQLISLGMGSTIAGLLIAIPMILFEGATRGRAGRLLDQMDAVAAALDEHIARLATRETSDDQTAAETPRRSAARFRAKARAERSNSTPLSNPRSSEAFAPNDRQADNPAPTSPLPPPLIPDEVALKALLDSNHADTTDKW